MNIGSVLALDVIFSIGLILILFIAAAIVIHMLVPYVSNVGCIDGQKANIKEINDTIENVRLTGITQIMKFKVESCVRCMWYNDSHINFKWTGQGVSDDPQSFGVGVPWNFNKISEYAKPSDDKTCGTGQIAGGQWCTFEITSNFVDVVSGCEKLT